MWRDLTFSLRGRVIDASNGRPLEGLHVRAYDRRLIWDDCLGCADTDGEGAFRIPLNRTTDDHDRLEVYIVVYGPELHQLHFTQPMQVTANTGDELRIALQTGVAAPLPMRDRIYAA
jgi:hypothetical protein